MILCIFSPVVKAMKKEHILTVDNLMFSTSTFGSAVSKVLEDDGDVREHICKQIKCSIQAFADSEYLEDYVNTLIENYIEENDCCQPPIPPLEPLISEAIMQISFEGNTGALQTFPVKIYKFFDQVSIKFDGAVVKVDANTTNPKLLIGNLIPGNVYVDTFPDTATQSVHIAHPVNGSLIDPNTDLIAEYLFGGLGDLLTIELSAPIVDGVVLPDLTITYLI